MNLLAVFCISATLAANLVLAEEHHKRAPSGFTGVRGKKSIPDSAYDSLLDDVDGIETPLRPEDYSAAVSDGNGPAAGKRAPSGFVGMRGKKPSVYVRPWEGTYPDAFYKRAPSGFMGMRGKKDNEFVGYDEKRAPSGFMGMRGKKENSFPEYQLSNWYSDKRAPVGFLGMRGKKGGDESSYIGDKRTPSGFFGMRGKKQPSGFFGMRGKKYPYEFRGKFVGVRGKKLSNEIADPEPDLNLDQLGEELDINQLMLLLTENEADNRESNENSNGPIRQ
ncbi:hypothetical protein NQ317_009443 [Molorchus minor]|uniref:Tachykinin n=1 Tax=Molorchus minor TaxID=1323400 RepID=A0ABQ9J0C8_9CUCU|nr:hypothetical protein NQ317_009443 [Molorchus minor]